jgi:hypothetical protein
MTNSDTAIGKIRQIDFAVRVFTERGDREVRLHKHLVDPCVVFFPHRPDRTRTVVAIDIFALQIGQRRSAIDVAACHRTMHLPGWHLPKGTIVFNMVIAHHRESEVRFIHITGRRQKDAIPFKDIPAIIEAARFARTQHVDFLLKILPHIPNVKIACEPIKAEAPGISQAVQPYFGAKARFVHERVIRRDAVGYGVNVQPQNRR